MRKKVWTVREVTETLNVDEDFIVRLQKEKIITLERDEAGGDWLLPGSEFERVRVAKVLMEEMDVNLPGVEVILGMRQSMIDMRRQFDDILEDISREVRRVVGSKP